MKARLNLILAGFALALLTGSAPAQTPEIKIVEAAPPPDAKEENIVVNKQGTFSAFTVSTQDGLERIFFTDLASRTHKTYEIQGVGWPNRPLNDPAGGGKLLRLRSVGQSTAFDSLRV